MKDMPIGIFDSGVGGLTVYRALHDRLPNERFVYLGDTARVPYGTKSLEVLVVACNTASALALPQIRQRIGIDVVGVIGPGARKAVEITKAEPQPKIGVIATEATVASKAYIEAIRRASGSARVLQAACPLFVPLAEENWISEPETFAIARKHLAPIIEFEPDALVLGCTHYPILRDVIRETVGENVALIDSGEAAAEETASLLAERGIASDEVFEGPRQLCDDLDHFYVTDAADRFARVAERFLGSPPSRIEAVEVYGVDMLGVGG